MTRPTIAAIVLALFCSSAVSDDPTAQAEAIQPALASQLSEQTAELAEARLRDSSEDIDERIQETADDKREQIASATE